MSRSEDKKLVVAPEVVSMMSKTTEHKLTDLNHVDWSKTIQIYIRRIRIANHLNKDPPTDDSKEQWMTRMSVSSYRFVIPSILRYLV